MVTAKDGLGRRMAWTRLVAEFQMSSEAGGLNTGSKRKRNQVQQQSFGPKQLGEW